MPYEIILLAATYFIICINLLFAYLQAVLRLGIWYTVKQGLASPWEAMIILSTTNLC